MRSRSSSGRGEGSATLLLAQVVLLVVAGLTGCTTQSGNSQDHGAGSRALAAEVGALLKRRAAAVRRGEMTRFLDTVAQRHEGLVDRQATYFLNLRQLPLARFRYVVRPGSVESTGDGAIDAVVLLRMQIEDFDAAPVQTPAKYSFVRNKRGRLRISSVRDRAFEKEHDLELAPWDLGRITVVEGEGVLGIFDQGSVDAAHQIVSSVADGIDRIRDEVPQDWSEQVIVYALSETRVLASLDHLPGGDPDRVDAVAFPVPAVTQQPRLASTRFILHPRMLRRAGPTRDRLIRHELTHVALGPRDDTVPTWLSEGIAEHVSVQPVPEQERTISQASVEAARDGVGDLPASDTFNGELSAANYGIAWFACEHIVSAYGEKTLWRLLEAMRADGGTSQDDQDEVLQAVLGIDSERLARAAGRKILATFG